MIVRLTCTKAQVEALHLAAGNGRSTHVAVNRRALQGMQVDHTRLIEAAKRAMDVVETGGKK